MTKRLRLLHVTVQPAFVLDDGENLEPLQVSSLTLTAAEWPEVVERFAKETAKLREQVENDRAPTE